jgi:hypothetical protein
MNQEFRCFAGPAHCSAFSASMYGPCWKIRILLPYNPTLADG